MLNSEDGPLWYRGLVYKPEAEACAELSHSLSLLKAEAMVVGHTIQPTGRVTFRCNRRLVMTDVGMSHAIRPTARAAILRATMQLNGSVAALTPMQAAAHAHSHNPGPSRIHTRSQPHTFSRTHIHPGGRRQSQGIVHSDVRARARSHSRSHSFTHTHAPFHPDTRMLPAP